MLASARTRLQVWLALPSVVWLFVAALVVTILATIGIGISAWSWSDKFSDQLAAVGVTFGVGTFVLAAVAGLIALAAYLVATQAPNLEAELSFPFMDGNALVLMVDPTDIRPDGYQFLANFRQLEGTVLIQNRAPFSARNPACRIELRGLAGLRNAGPGWIPVLGRGAAADDVTVVQWDGGADYLIHGEWPRPLQLDLRSVVQLGDAHQSIVVTIVADNASPRHREFDIRLLQPEGWLRHHPQDQNQVPVRIIDAVQGGPDRG